MRVANAQLDDMVLLRSDGTPTTRRLVARSRMRAGPREEVTVATCANIAAALVAGGFDPAPPVSTIATIVVLVIISAGPWRGRLNAPACLGTPFRATA